MMAECAKGLVKKSGAGGFAAMHSNQQGTWAPHHIRKPPQHARCYAIGLPYCAIKCEPA